MADEKSVPVEQPQSVSDAPKENLPKVESVHNVDGLIQKNRQLLGEIKDYKDKFKKFEEEKLIEREQWKTLAEERGDENKTLVAKIKAKDELIENSYKIGNVKKELSKLGIDSKYMDYAVKLVDLGTVKYDQESKIVTGAESAAKEIQDKLPPLFAGASADISTKVPDGVGPKLTLEEWRQLPADEQVKRKNEVLENMGVALKK